MHVCRHMKTPSNSLAARQMGILASSVSLVASAGACAPASQPSSSSGAASVEHGHAAEARPHGPMTHAPTAPENANLYRTNVDTHPAVAQAGQPTTLTITVRDGSGHAVSQLANFHEKPMHVIIVSKDLAHFAHVHPTVDGSSFRVEHIFEDAGEHFIIVDHQQPGRGQVVDRHVVRIAGTTTPEAPPLVESDDTQRADGLALTLRKDANLRAGEAAMLHFDVTDANTGDPVMDLEPYLGTSAHFMTLSADGLDFVHAHAIDDTRPSSVSAHAVFPRPGLYKMWVQVQRHGEVVTVPFVLRVGSANT